MYILIVLGIIGIVINFFLITTTSSAGFKGPATTAIWGYGAIAMSVIGLLFNMIGGKHISKSQNGPTFTADLLYDSMPSILLLIVLVSIISLNSQYHNRINKNEVAGEYYKYSTITSVTISTQYFLMLYYIINEIKGNSKDSFTDIIIYLNYLFTIGNISMIGMLLIIAKYFSTDG